MDKNGKTAIERLQAAKKKPPGKVRELVPAGTEPDGDSVELADDVAWRRFLAGKKPD
jgi:hypothetical protein